MIDYFAQVLYHSARMQSLKASAKDTFTRVVFFILVLWNQSSSFAAPPFDPYDCSGAMSGTQISRVKNSLELLLEQAADLSREQIRKLLTERWSAGPAPILEQLKAAHTEMIPFWEDAPFSVIYNEGTIRLNSFPILIESHLNHAPEEISTYLKLGILKPGPSGRSLLGQTYEVSPPTIEDAFINATLEVIDLIRSGIISANDAIWKA